MERAFGYRNGCIFFGSLWFGVFGFAFFAWGVWGALTGNPVPVSNNGHALPTTGLYAWFEPIASLVPMLIAAGLYMFAVNAKVVLSDDGVRITNMFGRTAFQAAWNEITSVHELYESQGNPDLMIEAGKRRAVVTSSIIGMADLEQAIAEKLGPLDPPTTDIGMPLSKMKR